MRTISRNKVTGRRINGLATRTKAMGAPGIRMGSMSRWVNEDHVAAVTERSGEPLMGVEADGMIDIKHIAGVFDDEDVLDAEVDYERKQLVLTTGRNEYRFPILDADNNMPNLGKLEWEKRPHARFKVDADALKRLLKSKDRGDYVAITTGRGKGDRPGIYALLMDNITVVNGARIGDWDPASGRGEPRTFVGRDVLAKGYFLKNGDTADISDDYPVLFSGSDEGVDWEYLVAPRVDYEDGDRLGLQTRGGNIREWVASHNARGGEWYFEDGTFGKVVNEAGGYARVDRWDVRGGVHHGRPAIWRGSVARLCADTGIPLPAKPAPAGLCEAIASRDGKAVRRIAKGFPEAKGVRL